MPLLLGGLAAGLALGLALAPASSAQSAALPVERLDSLRSYVRGLAAFGLDGQVLVARGDSVLLERAAGVADSAGHRMGLETAFAVGSITKSLTAALIVRLESRHKLSFDDTIDHYLHDVPEDKRRVTLRQLLTHTSGLPMDAEAVDEDDSREEVVHKILREPLRFAPGDRFGYSNAGYQLLAAVVESVSGATFPELAKHEIFDPCKMTHSSTGAEAARARRDAASGRNEWSFLGSLRHWRQRWAGTGAGDMVTTAHDLWRWARALQGDGPLSAAELDTLLSRRVPIHRGLYYGFGVYLVPAATGPDLISIGGDVRGYHAAAWAERRAPWRASVVTASGEQYGRGLLVTAIQRALWRLMEGAPVSMPPATVEWPAARLRSLAGDWELHGGGRLVLAPDPDGLRLGLSGPPAMDLLLGPDSVGTRTLLDGRAEQVLRASAASSDSALIRALHPVERDLWEDALRKTMGGLTRRLGPLLGIEPQGTVPLPWLVRGTRTYMLLRFARGTTDASLAWLEGGLLDVAFGEGRPQPVLLPVAPLAAGGLGAWDAIEGRTIRIEPFMDERGAALRVTGAGTHDIARRPPAAGG